MKAKRMFEEITRPEMVQQSIVKMDLFNKEIIKITRPSLNSRKPRNCPISNESNMQKKFNLESKTTVKSLINSTYNTEEILYVYL